MCALAPPAPSAGGRLRGLCDSILSCCSPPRIAVQPVRPMVDNSTAHHVPTPRPQPARQSQHLLCSFARSGLTGPEYLPGSDNARKGPAPVPSFASGPHPGGHPQPASDAQGRPDSQYLSSKKSSIWYTVHRARLWGKYSFGLPPNARYCYSCNQRKWLRAPRPHHIASHTVLLYILLSPAPQHSTTPLTRVSQAVPVLQVRGSQAPEYSHTSSAG